MALSERSELGEVEANILHRIVPPIASPQFQIMNRRCRRYQRISQFNAVALTELSQIFPSLPSNLQVDGQDIRIDQDGFQDTSLLRRFPLRSCRTYAPASDRSSRSLHIPTIAFIACLRLVCETPYLSLTAMRTSSEIDVRRCRDWICSAFQISSSRYSCVRFMMYRIHHRFRKTSLTIAAIARSRQNFWNEYC